MEPSTSLLYLSTRITRITRGGSRSWGGGARRGRRAGTPATSYVSIKLIRGGVAVWGGHAQRTQRRVMEPIEAHRVFVLERIERVCCDLVDLEGVAWGGVLPSVCLP
jgi:hypothetical protein